MAKDGHKRPFRKWLAQTAETPMIFVYGVLLGGLSGAGLSTIDNDNWDASNVTPEQEVLFTQKIDAAFSEVSDLTSVNTDFSFEKQMAAFDKDTKRLEEFNAKQATLKAEISNKSNDIANKILSTPAISEKTAQAYSEKFNAMNLHNFSDFDFSDQNMRFRNKCLSSEQKGLCTQTTHEQEVTSFFEFSGIGGGVLLALSFFAWMAREERDWGNEWARMDDVPTLTSKVKDSLKTRKPSNN